MVRNRGKRSSWSPFRSKSCSHHRKRRLSRCNQPHFLFFYEEKRVLVTKKRAQLNPQKKKKNSSTQKFCSLKESQRKEQLMRKMLHIASYNPPHEIQLNQNPVLSHTKYFMFFSRKLLPNRIRFTFLLQKKKGTLPQSESIFFF